MNPIVGVSAAFIALFGWGFGDYLYAKLVRRTSAWVPLLAMSLLGVIVFAPQAIADIMRSTISIPQTIAFAALGTVSVISGVLYAEGMREGKIAIIEPILSAELPFTVVLGVALVGERIGGVQLALIAMTFIGVAIAMAHTTKVLWYHRRHIERGVRYGFAAALLLGITNVAVGSASASISPVASVWLLRIGMLVSVIIYLVVRGKLWETIVDMHRHARLVISESALNNVAWLAFAFATTILSTPISTSISQGYVAIPVILGIIISHERLQKHQLVGAGIALVSAIILALVVV